MGHVAPLKMSTALLYFGQGNKWLDYFLHSGVSPSHELYNPPYMFNLDMEWNDLHFIFLTISDYDILCLTASLMSVSPCRDVVIEVEDTKPLLASKVSFKTSMDVISFVF